MTHPEPAEDEPPSKSVELDGPIQPESQREALRAEGRIGMIQVCGGILLAILGVVITWKLGSGGSTTAVTAGAANFNFSIQSGWPGLVIVFFGVVIVVLGGQKIRQRSNKQ